MSRIITLGQLVVDQFPIWESNGYVKKSGESVFTKRLWKDGVADAVTITIAEIGVTGEYKASFTPDDVGFWVMEITIDYNKDVFQAEYTVEAAKLFINATLSDDATTSIFGIWFEENGERLTDLDSVAVLIKDTAGTTVVDLGTDTTDTGDGVFRFTTSSSNLIQNTAYTIVATATRGAETWVGMAGFARV
jgi:hypothetical protein